MQWYYTGYNVTKIHAEQQACLSRLKPPSLGGDFPLNHPFDQVACSTHTNRFLFPLIRGQSQCLTNDLEFICITTILLGDTGAQFTGKILGVTEYSEFSDGFLGG